MKSKLSWIFFVPLALIACFFKLSQALLPEGAIFGLSSLYLEYCYLGAVVLIFLFTLLFILIDKKTSAYYLPHRNYPAGLIGIVMAILLAADGGFSIFSVISSGKISFLEILGAVLSILSAIVFFVLGLSHSFRYKEGKSFSLINVLPAVMCAVRMILSFVQFTTVSLRLADVSLLICYVFATLFFFNYAIVLALIKTKNALKCCFLYGLPAVAVMISYGVYHLCFSFDTEQIFNNIQPLELLMMGLYILCVLIEITAFVRDKDSVTVIENDIEPVPDIAEEKVQGFIASNTGEDETDHEEDSGFLEVRETRDTEDFLYQEVLREVDDEQTEEQKAEMDSYLTEITEDAPDDRPKDYESRLDEIDKLILDINSKAD